MRPVVRGHHSVHGRGREDRTQKRSWPCPTGRNNRRASIGRLITARYAHAASLKARPHTAAIARQRSHGPVSVTKSLIIIVQGKSRVASPSYTSHRGHYLLMPRTATLRKSVVHWRGQPQRFPYLLIFPSPFYSNLFIFLLHSLRS